MKGARSHETKASGAPPTLRRVLFIASAVLAFVVAGLSISLILLTNALYDANTAMAMALRNVRVLEEVQIDLLAHDRAVDPVLREDRAGNMREGLASAVPGDAIDARNIADARMAIERYLRQPDADIVPAFRALERIINSNVQQARVARRRAGETHELATALGLAAMLAAVIALIAALRWTSTCIVKPITGLADALRRFDAGANGVRAPIGGVGELRELGLRFNDMAIRLSKKQEAMLTYLAGVAHDLRNPISTLRLSTHAIDPEKPLPPEDRLRRSMGVMHRQVARLERMVEDLLDAARIEAGHLDLRMERNDAGELARSVYELFRDTSPAHDLRLELPATPQLLRCDAARVEQALTNLLSNAIKYSPDGGRVTLRAEARHDELVYTVTDEGIGIPEDTLPFIWEPFRRAGDRVSLIPGVGLGLSTVKRIVEGHGGYVEVDSTLGRGSTFRLHLPKRGVVDTSPPVRGKEIEARRDLH